MGNKILFVLKHDPDGDNLIRYEMTDGGRVIEKEKVGGFYKDERTITPTEAGFAIAGRRYLDKKEGVWKLPGDLVGALSSAVADLRPAYWGVTLAQCIQKMKDPKYEIVDYEAIRAEAMAAE